MLRQALCSILMQEHANLELVIKDGDATAPITSDSGVVGLLDLVGTDRVRYSAGYDAGIFPAVNDCLRRATGDILYFMCSDDLLCPGALAAVESEFKKERYGGPFWLYGQTSSADVTGRHLGLDGVIVTRDEMLVHNRIGQPAVFWNRKLMNLVGMFDTRYHLAADYDLWLRFWQRCEPLFLRQTLGVFRHHEEQATRQAAAVELEAGSISARHRLLSDVIQRARSVQIARQAYDGSYIPETVN